MADTPKKNAATRFRPDVGKSVHLFVAPLIWTAVGIMLMIRGLGWIGFSLTCRLLFIGLFVGTVKSLTILDKSARKNLARIMDAQGKELHRARSIPGEPGSLLS